MQIGYYPQLREGGNELFQQLRHVQHAFTASNAKNSGALGHQPPSPSQVPAIQGTVSPNRPTCLTSLSIDLPPLTLSFPQAEAWPAQRILAYIRLGWGFHTHGFGLEKVNVTPLETGQSTPEKEEWLPPLKGTCQFTAIAFVIQVMKKAKSLLWRNALGGEIRKFLGGPESQTRDFFAITQLAQEIAPISKPTSLRSSENDATFTTRYSGGAGARGRNDLHGGAEAPEADEPIHIRERVVRRLSHEYQESDKPAFAARATTPGGLQG
ncbi:hypothetical protein K443DRAFT_12294 [Laccaria amethystina LaAM-08-1]|uniref:Uncharacterized protein n=1 Tax=Laccaria amethystina LaAM-08-1 TaxID=1095629 RepID=A0A0C9WJ77_9AGAR|nr:hypothetical protein K443DRAFT_12294 [Laccaria amethystina LaAM-08-1]